MCLICPQRWELLEGRNPGVLNEVNMQKPKTLHVRSDSTSADLHTAIYQGVTVASESVTFLVVAVIVL